MTTTTIASKKLILLAMDVYQDAITNGYPYLADESVISYLLQNDIDHSDAHSILCAISVADQYGLKLS